MEGGEPTSRTQTSCTKRSAPLSPPRLRKTDHFMVVSFWCEVHHLAPSIKNMLTEHTSVGAGYTKDIRLFSDAVRPSHHQVVVTYHTREDATQALADLSEVLGVIEPQPSGAPETPPTDIKAALYSCWPAAGEPFHHPLHCIVQGCSHCRTDGSQSFTSLGEVQRHWQTYHPHLLDLLTRPESEAARSYLQWFPCTVTRGCTVLGLGESAHRIHEASCACPGTPRAGYSNADRRSGNHFDSTLGGNVAGGSHASAPAAAIPTQSPGPEKKRGKVGIETTFAGPIQRCPADQEFITKIRQAMPDFTVDEAFAIADQWSADTSKPHSTS